MFTRPLTIILPYYENPLMLAYQYKNFRRMAAPVRQAICLIVVDDGSKDDPAVAEDIGVDLVLYRMLVDVRWNQDACRNLGAHLARTEWILMTDMDHLVPEQTLSHILAHPLNEDTVYTFDRVMAPRLSPCRPHPNSWLMTRSMYDRIGGYDERFAGFYGTDGDFSARVREAAKGVQRLDYALVFVPSQLVADAWTRRYGRKEPVDVEAIPRIAAARNALPDWRPLTLSFPWTPVGPSDRIEPRVSEPKKTLAK